MFTKGQEVKVTADIEGFSGLEVRAPFYARVTHVFADRSVQLTYEMCDRHTFMDRAIVAFEDIETP